MEIKEDTVTTVFETIGEAEYKKACEEINITLGLLSSKMRLVTATYQDNEKSTKALRKRQETLKDAFNEQQKMAEATSDSLIIMRSLGLDDTSPSVRRMETELNNLNAGMEQTKDEIKANSKELRKSNILWVAMGKVVGAVGKTIGAVGKSAGAVVMGLGSGFLGLGKMAVEAAAGAENLRGVLGEDAVKSLSDFDDRMQGLNASMAGLQGAASLVALPFLDVLAADGISIMDDFSQGLQDADGDMGKMAAVIETALGDAVNLITERMPELIDMGINILTALVEGIVDSTPQLAEAAVTIVNSLASGLIEMLPLLLDGALQLILSIAIAIGEALPELIPMIVELVMTLAQTLVENIPLFVEAAVLIIEGIAKGLLEALPIMADMGLKLIQGLWKGIKDAWKWLIDNIKGFFSDMMGSIRNIFGIHSPSTVFAELGKNMVQGLGIGFTGETGSVRQQLRASMHSLTNGLEAEMGIAPIQATVWGQYQSAPYLNISGAAGGYPFSDRAGGVQVVQNIYANETSYAGQQKEAARQMGVIARRFAL